MAFFSRNFCNNDRTIINHILFNFKLLVYKSCEKKNTYFKSLIGYNNLQKTMSFFMENGDYLLVKNGGKLTASCNTIKLQSEY